MTKTENEWTMRELTAEEIRDLVCNDEPEADDLLDWAVAHEIEGERRRWSTRVTTILMTSHGEYLAVEWDRANTESGDHEFWEQVPTPVQRSVVTSYKGTTKTSVTYEWTPLAGTSDSVREVLHNRIAEAWAKLSERTPYSNIPCVWLRKRDDSGALMESTAADVGMLDEMIAAGWEVV